MNMRTNFDPYGGQNPLVDKMIGNAYPVVRAVAMNIDIVKHVSHHLQNIYDVSQKLLQVDAVAANMPAVIAVGNMADQIALIQANMNQIASVANKLPELLVLTDNLGPLMSLEESADEMLQIHASLPQLMYLYTNSSQLLSVIAEIPKLTAIYNNLANLMEIHGELVALVAVSDALEHLEDIHTSLPMLEDIHSNLGNLVVFTPAMETKLNGIAAGATANATDAALRARSSHTGTQTASTISDFNSAALAAAPAVTVGAVGSTANANGMTLTGQALVLQPSSASFPGVMTSAQFTKLNGIATSATANDTDANLKNRANHTGTQNADTITDGTTNKVFTATNQTKLSGIATAATANDTDANLKNRANHTGTQAGTTVDIAAYAPGGVSADTVQAVIQALADRIVALETP